MFGSIGFPELLLIFAVILIVFGPDRLPEFAKKLGKFVRDFKSTVDEAKSTIEREIEAADLHEDLKKMEKKLQEDLVEPITSLPKEFELPTPDVPAAPPPPKADDHEEKSG